jgi:hypothetical protein
LMRRSCRPAAVRRWQDHLLTDSRYLMVLETVRSDRVVPSGAVIIRPGPSGLRPKILRHPSLAVIVLGDMVFG